MVIEGDLTVKGDTVNANVENISVEDPILYLANNQTGSASKDIGIIGERGDDINVGLIWDESADEFSTITTLYSLSIELRQFLIIALL